MAVFEILIPGTHLVSPLAGVDKRINSEPARDGKIPSGWGAGLPPGDKDVGRAPELGLRISFAANAAILVHASIIRPLGKKPFFFQLGVKIGRVGGMEHNVPEEVMSPCAVAAAAADQGMVTEAVQDLPAARALDILIGKRNAKPPAEHGNKQTWVVV